MFGDKNWESKHIRATWKQHNKEVPNRDINASGNKAYKKQNADYVVAGNYKTYWSLNGQIDEEENDHEEADSLMIRCLKLANDVMTTNFVKVYSSGTDIFCCYPI